MVENHSQRGWQDDKMANLRVAACHLAFVLVCYLRFTAGISEQQIL
jgi:hypothetical protein